MQTVSAAVASAITPPPLDLAVPFQRWLETPDFWYAGIPVIAVCQRKGGPGKTTLTRMLAEYLAIVLKLRVLLIDLDTQCGLSFLYLKMEMKDETGTIRPPVHPDYQAEGLRFSSADLWWTAAPVPYAATRLHGNFFIDILPGDKQLLQTAERRYREEQEREREKGGRGKNGLQVKIENRVLEFLTDCSDALKQRYDVVLMDTPAQESPITLSAWRAATHVLVPFVYEEQCVRGTRDMISRWTAENSMRPYERRLEILGIQPNLVKSRRKLHRLTYEKTVHRPGFQDHLSPIQIPDRGEFSERDTDDATPVSIFQLAPSNQARMIGEHFGAWVSRRLFNLPGKGLMLDIPEPSPLPKDVINPFLKPVRKRNNEKEDADDGADAEEVESTSVIKKAVARKRRVANAGA